MPTRCLIALETNEAISSVYCHHDGYPQDGGVGVALMKGYRNIPAIEGLLREGDIFSFQECRYTPWHYVRDMEESSEGHQMRIFRNGDQRPIVQLLNLAIEMAVEYVYLYHPRKRWRVYQLLNKEWKPLKDAIEERNW